MRTNKREGRNWTAQIAIVSVLSLILAACAGGTGSTTSVGPAESTEAADIPGQFVWMNPGGVLLEAETAAYIEPFEEATGIEVLTVSPVDFASIKTMVEAGRVEVDLIEFSPEQAMQFCDELFDSTIQDAVDMSIFDPVYDATPCAVPLHTFLHGYAYDKNVFGDNPPSTWADFFDTARFPGQRAVWNSGSGTNYEKALIADGVDPADLYPIDYDRAFAVYDSLGDDLQFWATPAELVQILQNRSVPLVAIWGPAATQAVIQGADDYELVFDEPIFLYNIFMVPKGAPNKAAALEFVKFVTDAERQEALVRSYPMGSTNTSVNPTEFTDPILERYYPGNVADNAIHVDIAWRAANVEERVNKWTEWATG